MKTSLKMSAICGALLATFAIPSAVAAESKVLNIYNWSDYVAPDTIKNFEKETGIKVRYDVYDSNEVLQAKLLTGRSGYDIVVPTNAFLAKQIQAGLYQKIDKNKIPNYKNLDPAVMQQLAKFDQGNQFSIPYFYSVHALGVNVDKVKTALGKEPMPDNIWDLLFQEKYVSKLKSCGVSVFDSPSEALPSALSYLKLDPNSSKDADWRAGADLYKKIRPYITRFSSSGYINEFANGSLCLVLGYGGDLNIAKARAAEAKKKHKLDVLVPKSGTLLFIDAMAIPKDAKNVDNAHKFLDYILRPKVHADIANEVHYAVPNKPAQQFVNKNDLNNKSIYLPAEVQKNSYLQMPLDSKIQRLQTRLWTEIKTRK